MLRARPSLWIPGITVAFGFVGCMMGFVRSFGGLAAACGVLGFTQGGLFTWTDVILQPR